MRGRRRGRGRGPAVQWLGAGRRSTPAARRRRQRGREKRERTDKREGWVDREEMIK